jgi:ADP-ribosylglycohydrolase
MSNNLMNGIMGLCVADALGVPVEFGFIRRNTDID